MPTQETDRRGIGAAVKNVAGHAGAWFRLEKELAALELKKKTVALGLGIGLGIGAALVALYAIGFCSRRLRLSSPRSWIRGWPCSRSRCSCCS